MIVVWDAVLIIVVHIIVINVAGQKYRERQSVGLPFFVCTDINRKK